MNIHLWSTGHRKKSEKFFNKTFRYYRHGVYKYWIMPSYTGGFLINRTLI